MRIHIAIALTVVRSWRTAIWKAPAKGFMDGNGYQKGGDGK
jgi:hypothetical protein